MDRVRKGGVLRMTAEFVVGLDVGATSSRALLARTDGRRVGQGTASGGNPVAHGVERAFAAIASALRAALGDVPPGAVRAAVLGMAGGGKLLHDPQVAALMRGTWKDVGLDCEVASVGDTAVAFAAGTPTRHGSVLIAGTGAVAAQIHDHQMLTYADGSGWLLGDYGSGFWLGREAVRAAITALESGATAGPLVRTVLTDVLGGNPDHWLAGSPQLAKIALIEDANNNPPVELSRLAPAVSHAAGAGDPAAVDIVRRAATHLVATTAVVRDASGDGASAIVLGGSLLTSQTPLSAAVRARLTERWPDATVTSARDGSAGAAWLAARSLPGMDDATATRLHHQLVAAPPAAP